MYTFFNHLSIGVFLFLLIFHAVIGWIYGWKRALYYGGLNLIIFVIFVIIYKSNPDAFSDVFARPFNKYVPKTYIEFTKFFLRDISVVLSHLISAVVLNIIFISVDVLLLKNLFKKYRVHSKNLSKYSQLKHNSKKGLFWKSGAGLVIQLACFLPIAINTTAWTHAFVRPITAAKLAETKKVHFSDELDEYSAFVQKSLDLVAKKSSLEEPIDDQDFQSKILSKWSNWNLLGNYHVAGSRLIALHYLTHDEGRPVVNIFTTILDNVNNLFVLNDLIEQYLPLEKTSLIPEQLTHIDYLNFLKRIIIAKTPNQVIQNELKKINIQIPEDTLTLTLKHPKLSQVISNLNKLYNDPKNQVIFNSLAYTINNFKEEELNKIATLIDYFDFSDSIDQLKRSLFGFGELGLQTATEQIAAINSNNIALKTHLTANQRLKLKIDPKDALIEYFTDRLHESFKKSEPTFDYSKLAILTEKLIEVFAIARS